MLNVIVDNLKKGNAEGRLFELSNVYRPKSLPLNDFPDERLTLAPVSYTHLRRPGLRRSPAG